MTGMCFLFLFLNVSVVILQTTLIKFLELSVSEVEMGGDVKFVGDFIPGELHGSYEEKSSIHIEIKINPFVLSCFCCFHCRIFNKHFSYSVSWKQYRIPKGALVIANLQSVSYDPKLFTEPEKFDPERFLDKNGQLNNEHLIIPFGVGRRVCLGEALARMEIFLFLTAVIQRYELLPDDTNNPPSLDGKLGTTYAPVPYKLRAIPRE